MRHSSIADALFPGTRQRLLGALLLNPRPWYAAELAAHLRVTRSSLQRELSNLANAGILKVSQNGNRTYYQPDASCPVFGELRSLILKTTGLIDVLRVELMALQKEIKVACVYGSIAAGNEASGSDIDLLVVGTIGLMDMVPLLERMTHKLQRQVNPTIYTPGEIHNKARSSHFVKSLIDSPMIFVVGTKSDLEGIIGRETHCARADKPSGD